MTNIPDIEQNLDQQIDIESQLDKLGLINKDILTMYAGYRERPAGYYGSWPASATEIGKYVGIKYFGHPLSRWAIHRRLGTITRMLKDAAL